MDIVTLLPFIVLIGAMFLMTRSAKKKQQAAVNMRNQMQPGTGVRTIGGLYATVKEVNDDTVLLEAAPGVHLVFAKNAIGAVLEDSEYNRIVHGDEDTDLKGDTPIVPDDASSLTEPAAAADPADDAKIDLGKKDEAGDAEPGAQGAKSDEKSGGDTDAK
ncbi:preprotein translocase subunit YajC [Streptomyces tirandamycinicus]|uniref:preprotein translocase subunit YajC n=1 Tax=Streptomyces tirandamycinicus TaxID=2174846 RepID=UPI002270A242|nr:preprotein translocase subunit YajC [Streptomyces tirandamycinicus]MCY0979764.1 preprotein translocase subunit YajC [Streptomyces tirandamycinicus]